MTAQDFAPDADHDRILLGDHRRHIDRIDRTILALLSERVRLGRTVAPIKRAAGLPVQSPEREAEILGRMREEAGRHLPSDSAERIFRVIIAETLAAQQDEP
ncbi:MAG TPA: chorismate mutase [Vicinamibacterales bacterium]|nr:chorismate mutase [Vicinamibacterales bacterium]